MKNPLQKTIVFNEKESSFIINSFDNLIDIETQIKSITIINILLMHLIKEHDSIKDMEWLFNNEMLPSVYEVIDCNDQKIYFRYKYI